MWAEALAGSGDVATAIEEYEVAVQLDPETPALRLALAQALIQADERHKARQVLEALLKTDPGNAEAKALLESLAP